MADGPTRRAAGAGLREEHEVRRVEGEDQGRGDRGRCRAGQDEKGGEEEGEAPEADAGGADGGVRLEGGGRRLHRATEVRCVINLRALQMEIVWLRHKRDEADPNAPSFVSAWNEQQKEKRREKRKRIAERRAERKARGIAERHAKYATEEERRAAKNEYNRKYHLLRKTGLWVRKNRVFSERVAKSARLRRRFSGSESPRTNTTARTRRVMVEAGTQLRDRAAVAASRPTCSVRSGMGN